MTTAQSLNLLRYRFAGTIGAFIPRSGLARLIGAKQPTANQLAFLITLNDLHAGLIARRDVKLIAARANALWRIVPLDARMNDEWKAIYEEVK